MTQNVISVPRSECSGPVSIRTTALWNGRRVEIARSYLVWRDRGLAVITGDGARPDSRSLRTPPLQFLPATGSRWTAAVAHDAAAYRAELDARLHDHGLSRRELRRLVSKPIHRLSADEMDTLIDIRDGLDPIRSGDVIQKVMPLKQSIDMLSDIANGDVGYYAKKGVPGFIAKFAHLTAISNHGTITPLRVFQKLGLGYNSTAFPAPSANPVHGVRMRTEIGFDGRGTPTSDVHDRMLPLRTIRGWMQDGTIDEHQWDAMSVPERRDRLEHLIDGVADTDLRTKLEASLERNSSRTFTSFDPFRGNGWAGHYEHYTPEVELRQNTPLTPGAELWRYNVDGTQEILAKWDGVRWHVI
ncbi:hypothetical protein ACRQ4C_16845 [Curtobacterium sp. SP.BCp]|uniref:hypothetical protein n=1 Tax=Curtobacterium sp. SP.BCp TaxID=3435230 RepID=UPI003F739465